MWFVVDDEGTTVDDNGGAGYASRNLIPTGHKSYVNDTAMGQGAVKQVDETGLLTGQAQVGEEVAEDAPEEEAPEAPADETDDGGDEPPAPEGDRQAAIVAAIGRMSAGNPDMWCADGSPKVDVIQNVLGYDITAEERDAVWAGMQTEDASE
jgi:hypothetical protein